MLEASQRMLDAAQRRVPGPIDLLTGQLIAGWLTQHRPENGKAAKKMLAANARAEFSGDYTERAFNEAYREVYRRRRGRPRGSEK